MKKLVTNTIAAKTAIQENKSVFTITDIKNLFFGIKELEMFDISVKPGRDGSYIFKVGQSTYKLSDKTQNIYGKNS